jgi:hypothetical protein
MAYANTIRSNRVEERITNDRASWHRSKARDLLFHDHQSGNIKDWAPRQIHASRPEYQEFQLKAFRDHYKNKDVQKSYWLHQKRLKQQQK